MPPPIADSTKDVDKKHSQRKINKPLIEKRRRARINECLSQLKTIVLSATESKSPRPSKLEKADILEMTVEFVKNRLHPATGTVQKEDNENDDNKSEYLAGYSKCLNEISKFLEHTRPINSSLKQDIVEHVSGKLKRQLPSQQSMDSETVETEQTQITQNTNPVTTEEAIDLRLCNKEHGVLESPDESNQTFDSQKHQAITVTSVQNTSTPVGLVCGGQVMFLVQIPQTLVSQTMSQTPLTTSQHNQPYSMPISMTSYPITNQISNSHIVYPSSQSQNILPIVGLQTVPTSNQIQTDMFNTHAQVLHPIYPQSNIENVRTEQGDIQNQDHWRPW